ncbi:adaptor protein MecA [Salibacterium aidingense]|uniref:adaptor protein MecA n=1 Tax=Salibacterium aidingense TaxID=384933 RepID=UPI003BC102F0
MELYTWPEDRVKVIIHKEEWLENGWDPYEGNISSEEAERFFTMLFQMICDHFYMEDDIQLNAEMRQTQEDAVFLVIECLDEAGNKLRLRQTPNSRAGMMFRFAKKEDLVSFAERAKANNLKGGTFIVFYPCYYLLFDRLDMKRHDKLIMLLEEYGERSYLDTEYVRNRGKVIRDKSALQYLAGTFH